MARVNILEIEENVNPEIYSPNEMRTTEEGRYINLTGNRDLLREELSSKLRSMLKLMKFAGEYYGDTSLEEIPEVNSNFPSRIYCAIVLLGKWMVFVQAVASLISEGFAEMKNTYFLLIFGIWYLQSAGVNMACLFALPKTHKRSSRFSKFISNLLVTANDGHFRGLTKFKLNVLLVLTGFITIANSTCLVFLDFYQNTLVARFRPWNGLLAIRLLNASFNVFNSFAWVMPIFLFGVSSSLLSRMLDGFQKKASTENPSSLNIG